MSEKIFRSGFVSIVGRPNVGKSTLLNRILGEKLMITSDKPQTTRNQIKGIHNVPDGQIVFLDTPGIHRAKTRLNKFMVEEALSSVQGVDLILFLVDGAFDPEKEAGMIKEVLSGVEAPVILVLNKIDLIPKGDLLGRMAAYGETYPFKEIIPVSAASGDGVEQLVQLVHGLLPEGPCYFPDDILTDVPERFIVAEIIREKIFRLTRDEVPYSTAVVVDSFKERETGVVAIQATINVERDSQKGIIIGRKGEMLKKIGSQARQEIERLLDTKVFLELFVRVSGEWSDNSRMLKEFGYDS
ncbi:GTPase Era [Geomonas paludis]|uniref:GTPase Era n=1 Tax=Geomonas paludis TaxID=2740185 RepID=A0A6V8MWJ5_9BACT|nr:GTPase Era [Geomonas paludis]UPU34977.1 GTPase Era [Geomonas paludis]GFO64568.1 GTPase Era [Geomonas paludis]